MKEKEKLLRKKAALLKELQRNQDFIKGSLSSIKKKNKSGSPAYYLTYKDENQKTHTKYIKTAQFNEARSSIKQMKRVREIINEISKVNIDLLKKGATNDRF